MVTPRPTPGELNLLTVLWDRGPSTVHDVLAALGDADVGYTTVLKQLQVMDAKGLVSRDASRRPHVFRAAVQREATQSSLLSTLVDRAFGGSAGTLVLRALSDSPPTKDELREIRELLDQIEKEDA